MQPINHINNVNPQRTLNMLGNTFKLSLHADQYVKSSFPSQGKLTLYSPLTMSTPTMFATGNAYRPYEIPSRPHGPLLDPVASLRYQPWLKLHGSIFHWVLCNRWLLLRNDRILTQPLDATINWLSICATAGCKCLQLHSSIFLGFLCNRWLRQRNDRIVMQPLDAITNLPSIRATATCY